MEETWSSAVCEPYLKQTNKNARKDILVYQGIDIKDWY